MAKRGERQPWRVRFFWIGQREEIHGTETFTDEADAHRFIDKLRATRDGWHARGETHVEVTWTLENRDRPGTAGMVEQGTTAQTGATA